MLASLVAASALAFAPVSPAPAEGAAPGAATAQAALSATRPASTKPIKVRPRTTAARVASRSLKSQFEAARLAAGKAEARAVAAEAREQVLEAKLRWSSVGLVLLGVSALLLGGGALVSHWRAGRRIEERDQGLAREADLHGRLAQALETIRLLESRIDQSERRDEGPSAPAPAPKGPASVREITEAQLKILKDVPAGGEVIFPAPLVNGQERKVLGVARAWAAERSLFVSAQVGMAGFLATEKAQKEKFFRTYMAKRADFVIHQEDGTVLLVVEHNGGGHYEEGAVFRDKVKRRLLHLAGIGLLVTYEEWDEAKIRARLAKAMAYLPAAVPQWPEKVRRPPVGARRLSAHTPTRQPEARP